MNLKQYKEKDLQLLLKHTRAFVEARENFHTDTVNFDGDDLPDAAEQARAYATRRNAGRSGSVKVDDDESKQIRVEIVEWLHRTKRDLKYRDDEKNINAKTA